MDADLQDSPEEIPALRRMILEEGYDLVSGWKRKRHDPIGKRWPSKFFNWTARAATGIRLHDFNCGLKPTAARWSSRSRSTARCTGLSGAGPAAGFRRIGEKVVDHHARKYGHSKFGLERMVKGYLDLISVLFMSHFGRSPMYFFGGLGTVMFLLGGATTVWIIARSCGSSSRPPAATGCRPAALLPGHPGRHSGVQLFLAGFIGELINRSSSDRNKY